MRPITDLLVTRGYSGNGGVSDFLFVVDHHVELVIVTVI